MGDLPLLTIMVFFPLLGGIVLWGTGLSDGNRAKAVAMGFSLAPLIPLGHLMKAFDGTSGLLQFVERREWIPSLNIDYFLAIDGLGIVMLILTSVLVPFSIASTSVKISNPRSFFSFMLFLQTGLFGTFTAQDFFHWFLFWELSLIPSYFLVRLWGSAGAKEASVRFFLYTMVGSIAMLVGYLLVASEAETFSFEALANLPRPEGKVTTLAFWLVFLGFAVKTPLMPFHAWLPDTYATAPSSVSMLLTGAMSKMGVYGFLRILAPIFPEQLRQGIDILLILAIVTILGAALAAVKQTELKRLLAYSSINHLGYCLLGIFAVVGLGQDLAADVRKMEGVVALNGVIVQIFSHGLIASALFCLTGLLFERTSGPTAMDQLGGLRSPMPALCGFMGFFSFASLGLPGLSGFLGEFLIFKGVFGLGAVWVILASPGLLLTALFLLSMLQTIFYGPLDPKNTSCKDLSFRERALLLPVVGLVILVGVYPGPLMVWINKTSLLMVNLLVGTN